MIITNSADLRTACDRLRAAGSFAADTEFIPEGYFYPRLAVVQVATREFAAIIDPAAVGSLDPFLELIADPAVEKVFHDGRTDLEILYDRGGRLPRNVFDTQIGAALAGGGDRVSFARLVERATGVRLAKLETRSDWTHRPLTASQIEYALDDVRHLLPAHAHVVEKLTASGRMAWAREECRRFETEACYERTAPREAFRKVRGSLGLEPKGLALLRELAAWREEEARERDLPREFLLRDDDLVELARRAPTKEGLLRGLRIRNQRILDECGAALVGAVKRGLGCAPEEWPAAAPPREEAEEAAPLQALCEAWLRTRCLAEEVAPGLVATREELSAFVAAGPAAAVPLLSGWRRTLIGEELVELRAGRLAVAVDPASGRLVRAR